MTELYLLFIRKTKYTTKVTNDPQPSTAQVEIALVRNAGIPIYSGRRAGAAWTIIVSWGKTLEQEIQETLMRPFTLKGDSSEVCAYLFCTDNASPRD